MEEMIQVTETALSHYSDGDLDAAAETSSVEGGFDRLREIQLEVIRRRVVAENAATYLRSIEEAINKTLLEPDQARKQGIDLW